MGSKTAVEVSGIGATAEAGATAYLDINSIDTANNSYLFSSHYASTADQMGSGSVVTTNTFLTNTSLDLRANKGYVSLTMYTNATVYDGGYNVSLKSFATLDPYVYIDPTFADASLYTLSVSQGLGNSAVPEPASILGLVAGLGLFVRRRRGASTSRLGTGLLSSAKHN